MSSRRTQMRAHAALVSALWLWSGTFQVAQGAEPAEERIQMLAGGKCLVRGEKLDCTTVASYLREQLKLARGHVVRVRAGPIALSYQQLHALFDSLTDAGFATHPPPPPYNGKQKD